MAVRTRDGTSAQVWSHAASWSADTAPATGDTAIIPSTDGIADITGESQASVDLAKLITVAGCRVSIGSSGTPLIIGAAKYLIHGLGSTYIQNDGGVAENVVVNSPNMDTALILTGSAVTRINLARGGISVNTTAATAVIGSIPQLRHSCVATLGASFSATEYMQMGGRVSHGGSSIARLKLCGGTFTDTGSGGHALIQTGGTFLGKTANASWTLDGSYILGGRCDLRGIEAPVTINELFVGPNADLKYDPAVVTITRLVRLADEFRLAA